ncbi:hypothetical protein Y032_0152g2855 [Ancylostoma ceylanicum]|uniref:Uncharacterized protein n=1 Tax=Ancylostoma ceylanicum TaxID=53326 RepID=A0A016T0M1_9BILA|nr:hypothetical protein Y032_0152g2855 [Ancylostoma ceylanicum]
MADVVWEMCHTMRAKRAPQEAWESGVSRTNRLVTPESRFPRYSTKFAERAKKIANEHIKENGKELIVIRRFEIEDKVPVPRTHTALKKLIQSRLAFEFHHKLFPAGHTIEALWEWFRRSDANRDPYVWEIPYKLVL